jgi:hypothetical protein
MVIDVDVTRSENLNDWPHDHNAHLGSPKAGHHAAEATIILALASCGDQRGFGLFALAKPLDGG